MISHFLDFPFIFPKILPFQIVLTQWLDSFFVSQLKIALKRVVRQRRLGQTPREHAKRKASKMPSP